MKIGYLKKDIQERIRTNGRGYFVNAWRIVDTNGRDIIQPWSNTKTEARATAAACNITLKEVTK